MDPIRAQPTHSCLRRAGNRHAGFDEAGAGNVPTGAGLEARLRKRRRSYRTLPAARQLSTLPTSGDWKRSHGEEWGTGIGESRREQLPPLPAAYRASRRLYPAPANNPMKTFGAEMTGNLRTLLRTKLVDEQGEGASPTLSALRAYGEHRAAGRRGVPPHAPLDFAPCGAAASASARMGDLFLPECAGNGARARSEAPATAKGRYPTMGPVG